ncbi:unnamed protein product [Gongylonema pulchrum]|uniref:Secreted protein n=1 Tax=Gongylonema pulchrum TaxID=637853 RepID=A0A183EP10_9BILA|nr:unnamed protein product [Gongylonema pulchrum]
MFFYWFFVLLLAKTTIEAYELKCTPNATAWTQEDSLPAALALKDSYNVVVRHTDWNANRTSLVNERRTPTYAYVTTISRNKSSCTALPDVAALPSLYMQTELAKIVGFNGNSMAQLINFLLKYNFTEHHFENATQLVGGIDAVLWLGCRNDNKTIVQVLVRLIF